jgi:hypothetical protein
MPEKFDALVQTRCFRTTIATLAKFFVESGRPPRSQYELIRWALEEYVRILSENHIVDEVVYTSDAQEILESLRFDFSGGGRTDKAFFKNLTEESLKLEKLTLPQEKTKATVEENLREAMKSVPKNVVVSEGESK